MSTDFERTKHEFGGRSILITSWYDDKKETWRASAPSYSHLQALSTGELGACATRKAAVDTVIKLLLDHFSVTKSVSTERIIFL